MHPPTLGSDLTRPPLRGLWGDRLETTAPERGGVAAIGVWAISLVAALVLVPGVNLDDPIARIPVSLLVGGLIGLALVIDRAARWPALIWSLATVATGVRLLGFDLPAGSIR
jgi:hypothetical protein